MLRADCFSMRNKCRWSVGCAYSSNEIPGNRRALKHCATVDFGPYGNHFTVNLDLFLATQNPVSARAASLKAGKENGIPMSVPRCLM